ncbi:NAD(P)-dependent dehydrogenase (short-subunit alcohol dehydrogenase family) [Paenibacillus phyllosphaerae]|uniref:NAD(P)-dependent dehydrogenase (Short-subunit alcohol dehydrogenase family) n=1 Tax=Paenibacillus phyllosphaerae TaxID=274593 RepID=A0A7W5AW27_9BACL|nr:SDR family NAD(P)-dependent oxidoreductase [Paenibacillus phyllosphaerae]MBB3109763.1 NAD(P)-dependent dehydrogenase (short-subunit alcohol dehydrogenase family) [Paenibacillus phyllosphaerae]
MNNDQKENIALITGANAGIGLELTRRLLTQGWQVVAMNRSDFPADDKRIQDAVKEGRLRVYPTVDLADYASLRRTLETIKSKEQRLDILFNNAGGSFPELSYSQQGRERHYELMTVVPFIILMELIDLLRNGRLKTVINTSSSALKFTRELSIETLEQPKTFRKLLGPYAASKLALSLWTQAIAPQLAMDGIKIRSVDPGGNNTLRKGKPSGLPLFVEPLMKLFFPPPSHGADKLYDGALGIHSKKTGVFVQKGQIAAIKFENQAQPILARINEIYKHEFLLRDF